jgi:maltose alpha-D-glucosyltransferase/alpha-amylase
MDNNRRRIELLNSLLLSFPGTPIMYYGDEIGMGDNIYLGDRNGVRTPMQWNSDRNAGFSRAVPAKLYFPVIMDPIWGYQAINVEAQQSDPSSLLHWTRNMIALRKLFQVFGRGTLEFLHPENRKVLAYVRCYEADGHSETVLCVANLSRFAQPVQLDLAKFAGRQPVEMLGYVPFPPIDNTPYALTLAPYSFFWLELQPGAPQTEAPVVEQAQQERLARMSAAPGDGFSLQHLLDEPAQALLRDLLPPYLQQQRWYGGKSETIASARVASATPIPATDGVLATVEVSYASGDAALYQLPLAIATAEDADALRANSPKAIIATLNTGAQDAAASVLYDASANAAFRAALLRMILEASATAAETATPSAGPESTIPLVATRSATMDAMGLVNEASRVGSAEQSNTSILYGEQAILKLFRRLRTGENSDVEIARFLTDVAHFEHIPRYFGDLRLASDGTTVAFLQAFAANEGDGWQWTLDELARFYESVANCPPPASTGSAPSLGALEPASEEIREHAGLYLDAAHLLGVRTAELHLALATPTDNQAFAAEPFSANDLELERRRMLAQLGAAMDALAGAEERSAEAEEILAARAVLEGRIAAVKGEARGFGARIRIHGDYHLGQLLRAHEDFLIVDFEGEPARPLEERRRKQSPLRDVAGMLRSFSYAARTGLDHHASRRPEQAAALAPWATLWENSVGHALLRGYTETISADPKLLPGGEQAQPLLTALLIEKAAYELLYELNNRPAWLPIPLAGLLGLIR